MIMAYFNEDNVTEQMCIAVAKEAGYEYVTGQNEVRKMLRTILWLKYKIKDNEVFEKAYKYVEMYYTPDNGGHPFQAKEVDVNEDSLMVAEPWGGE